MNKIRFEVVAHRAHSGMLAIFVKCSQYGSSIELDTDVRAVSYTHLTLPTTSRV